MSSDKHIWRELQAGRRSALEALFRRYHQDLFRYALKFCGDRQLAEDHLQSLFLRIWERRARLGEVQAVKTYLWTALRRSLITAQKEQGRWHQPLLPRENEERFVLSAEELVIKKEQKQRRNRELEHALGTLSPRQREVLYLRFYEGMSYQEIEEITSISYQVARNYLSESLQRLRQTLTSDSPVLLSVLLSILCFV